VSQHVVMSGPIRERITLDDGTEYDCRPDFVEVASPEHAAELARLIGEHYESAGHPLHDSSTPFRLARVAPQED
jgi:hypothetical protein